MTKSQTNVHPNEPTLEALNEILMDLTDPKKIRAIERQIARREKHSNE